MRAKRSVTPPAKTGTTHSRPSRPDRRVQRTRRLLSRALVELIVEKGSYERVTVQDILDRADVGRSTFYAHYENKDLLLVDGPRNMGLALFGETADADTSAHHAMEFRALLEHVNESRALAKAMIGSGAGTIIISAFRAQIADAIRRHYQKRLKAGPRDHRLVLTYLADAAASGVISLLTSWIDDGYRLPVETLSGACRRLVEGVFHGI